MIVDNRKDFQRKTEYNLIRLENEAINEQISIWIRLKRNEGKAGCDFILLRKVFQQKL